VAMITNQMIEAAARELCRMAGHDPDGIGDPPPDDGGVGFYTHAFPRWIAWQPSARAALEAAETVRERTIQGNDLSSVTIKNCTFVDGSAR
jgi:hypothetical protein